MAEFSVGDEVTFPWGNARMPGRIQEIYGHRAVIDVGEGGQTVSIPLSELEKHLPDPFENPEFQDWADHVRTEVIPMIRDSPVTFSIAPPPDKVDVKFAVELGFLIMMDKPIILCVPPGTPVPDKLARVADAIIEMGPDWQRRAGPIIKEIIGKVEEIERKKQEDG
jgi:hypothetical protein